MNMIEASDRMRDAARRIRQSLVLLYAVLDDLEEPDHKHDAANIALLYLLDRDLDGTANLLESASDEAVKAHRA